MVRKITARPAAGADAAKRRRWTISALAIAGWKSLGGLEGAAIASEWRRSWRLFEDNLARCPIDPAAFGRAVVAWPRRDSHPRIVDDWRLRQTNAPRRTA